MIDCENEVFTRVATMLREQFKGIDVSGEYVNTPSDFPHVSITMSDNPIDPARTTGSREMAEPMFEVNIYSNKAGTKKTECKKIAAAIDKLLFSMNFVRTALTPVPNLENATIYRIVARYRVATDGTNFYRR